MAILVFEDKLGITSGYLSTWENALFKVGLNHQQVRRYSIWKSPATSRIVPHLLVTHGNRKTPGFNPSGDIQLQVLHWVYHTIDAIKPEMIVIMDMALLGILEPNWANATIDNMRGGVYKLRGRPCLVMTPISAINTQRSVKDIRAMNDGAESENEFEADEDRDPNELFIEPYSIKSGRWIFFSDLRKLSRLMTELK